MLHPDDAHGEWRYVRALARTHTFIELQEARDHYQQVGMRRAVRRCELALEIVASRIPVEVLIDHYMFRRE